jgi:ApaG domain
VCTLRLTRAYLCYWQCQPSEHAQRGSACRFFEIAGPWETQRVGSRGNPEHGVLGKCPVVLPGYAVMYKSSGSIARQGGVMRGGYKARGSPTRLRAACAFGSVHAQVRTWVSSAMVRTGSSGDAANSAGLRGHEAIAIRASCAASQHHTVHKLMSACAPLCRWSAYRGMSRATCTVSTSTAPRARSRRSSLAYTPTARLMRASRRSGSRPCARRR